jgi:hypothetical protein
VRKKIETRSIAWAIFSLCKKFLSEIKTILMHAFHEKHTQNVRFVVQIFSSIPTFYLPNHFMNFNYGRSTLKSVEL